MTIEIYQVAIVGAGPAGLSAAVRAAEKGVSHILLEATPQLSNTIFRFQKGKHVMAEPTRLPLRSSLGFEAGSREQILESWCADAARLDVQVRHHSEVKSIVQSDGAFSLQLSDGDCIASDNVVIAIGLQGQPRKLGIPGEDERFVVYQLDDPEDYEDQVIAVIGAGDSAIENALALASRSRVVVVNRGPDFRRAKTANRVAIERAIASDAIQCFFNSSPTSLEALGEQARLTLRTAADDVDLLCDRVLARLGAIPPRVFLESCGVRFAGADSNAMPILHAQGESDVKGLYIIGALAGCPLIKQALNQGFEVIEKIRGQPVQSVEDSMLVERYQMTLGLDHAREILERVRNGVTLLSQVPDRPLHELLSESRIVSPEAGTVVFRRNDYSDCFYSILGGCVSIHPDSATRSTVISLTEGHFFGETELSSGRRRRITVVAGDGCRLLETPRHAMNRCAAALDPVAAGLNTIALRRAMQWHWAPGLPMSELEELIQTASCRHFASGDALFLEGEVGDSVHFIRSGSVIAAREIGGMEVPYRYLSAGDYVGEWAVITDSTRGATVRATAHTETFELQGTAVKNLLQRHPEFRQKFQLKAFAPQSAKSKSSPRSGDVISFLMDNGVGEATDVLIIDESACIRCDNCERACADTHGGVSRLDREAGPTFASVHLPTSCRHCLQPHCMSDCPPNAIQRASNGEVVIDQTCIGCGNCVANCPYGVIRLAPTDPTPKPNFLSRLLFGDPGVAAACGTGNDHSPKQAVKCDMCEKLSGGPACVAACPTGAAIRISPEQLLPMVSRRAHES